MLKQGRIARRVVLGREDAIAICAVSMLTFTPAVIGLAAITSTSLDIKMAGGERLRESTLRSEERRVGKECRSLRQPHDKEENQATLTGAGANPSITLPLGTAPGQDPLQAHIRGQC